MTDAAPVGEAGSTLPRRFWQIARATIEGTFDHGFTYAGNLAYLSLVTLFPFFIVAAAAARLIGHGAGGADALDAFLLTLPRDVADVLRTPAHDVLEARSGTLLWFGALVGLWTTASLIETLRGIIRAAYDAPRDRPFYHYRLGSLAFIVAAVLLTAGAFSAQVFLTGAATFIARVMPLAPEVLGAVQLSRVAPALALFAGLYMLFLALTPASHRRTPNWPGALFVTLWWLGTTALLPAVLGTLARYDLTYGSLAGVMIALIFFYVIGLGMVMGAQLNAALAQAVPNGLESGTINRSADMTEKGGR